MRHRQFINKPRGHGRVWLKTEVGCVNLGRAANWASIEPSDLVVRPNPRLLHADWQVGMCGFMAVAYFAISRSALGVKLATNTVEFWFMRHDLLSGVLAQVGCIQACLWGSAAMLAICLAVTFLLPVGAEARRVVV